MEAQEPSENIASATSRLRAMRLHDLIEIGLGRSDEEYYLAGMYHPLRHMKPVTNHPLDVHKAIDGITETEVDVYIHVPFCHVNCSFCHFYKEITPRNKDNRLENIYLAALTKEIEHYTHRFGESIAPRSIQFGGGTPSALSQRGLDELLAFLQHSFDTSRLKEVKFEFHPDLASNIPEFKRKIRSLKEFGLTTAIIDLEATDPKVLKAICRGNTSHKGFKALINVAKNEGVASVASAYMTGLPFETLSSFERTMIFLSNQHSLDAVNIYPLMFKPSDTVFNQRRLNPSDFPTLEEKDIMLILASDILHSAEFSEVPCHFFRRTGHRPVQQTSKASSNTLLGLGPASFGYLDGKTSGLQYMNFPDLQRYVNAIESGTAGIWRASVLNVKQKALRALLFALNSYEAVPIELVNLAAEARQPGALHNVVSKLISVGLLVKENGAISFSSSGRMRNAEVMFYLAEKSATRWNYDDPEYALIRRYEFFPDISADNRSLFHAAAPCSRNTPLSA